MKSRSTGAAATFVVVAAVVCLTAGDATAQSNPRATDVMEGAPVTSPSSPVSTPSALSLSSNTQGTTASGKVSANIPSYIWPTSELEQAASLSLSTPVSKGSTPTTFASLGGFTNSTTGTIQYSFTYFPDINGAPAQQLTNDCYKAMIAAGYAPLGVGQQCSSQVGLTAKQGKEAAFKQWGDDYAQLLKPAIPNDKPRVWIATMGATFDSEQHTWYDAKTLAKSQVTDMPVTAGPSFTYVDKGWNTAVTLQFQYGTTDKDQATKTLCPNGTGVVSCVNGAIGSPKKTTQDTFSFEVRQSMTLPLLGTPSGFAPKVSYDTNSHTYGFKVPYFLFGCAKQLNAGVEFDWSSDTHHPAVGLFVSQPFSVFDQGSAASKCSS